MSRKVIFKASVERAKREGENVTCRLSKDLPLSEAAQLVNENRTLLIEKEMTSEEFYIFLHEISKFVQKEPGYKLKLGGFELASWAAANGP